MAKAQEVEYQGKKYASRAKAARAHGITPQAMAYRLKADKGKGKGNRTGEPFMVLGMKFESRVEAAKTMKISYDQLNTYESVRKRVAYYKMKVDGII